jgi:hypothetical protein
MHTITRIADLRDLVREWRLAREGIAFVKPARGPRQPDRRGAPARPARCRERVRESAAVRAG